MGYGANDSAQTAWRAQLLDEIVQGRAEVLTLAAAGRLEEARKKGEQLLANFFDYELKEPPAEIELGLLPHFIQGIALVADMSFAAILVGDNARGADLLRNLLRNFDQLGSRFAAAGDQLASLGLVYCKDGRPSLDGSCLKIPPCPTP